MYYIFAFRSRTGAIRFFESLKKEGVCASLLNTPKTIGIGCGLSVKAFDLAAGRRTLSGGYANFFGVYLAERSNGGGIKYTRL